MKHRNIFLLFAFVAVTASGFMADANATITAFLSAGSTCTGAVSDHVSKVGQSITVSVCVSTTTESLCGSTLKFDVGNANDAKKFSVISRTLGRNFPDPNNTAIVFPVTVPSPALGNDFGGTRDGPAPPGPNQLLATFQIRSESKLTAPSLLLKLNQQSLVVVDKDGRCESPSSVPLQASYTINQD